VASTLELVPVQKFVVVLFAVSIIFSIFYFSFPSAAGTAEAAARQRQEETDRLSGNI